MAAYYITAGRRLYRKSTIKLSPPEKAALAADGTIVLCRPVEWPLPDREADLGRAAIDPGGTDIWGPGPYLKVPNHSPADGDEVWNRVFCPWGYPPDRVRVAWSSRYLQIARIDLVRAAGDRAWDWVLTLSEK